MNYTVGCLKRFKPEFIEAGKQEAHYPDKERFFACIKISRNIEPFDGKRYEWRKMIELSRELDRLLTDEKAEKFRIK